MCSRRTMRPIRLRGHSWRDTYCIWQGISISHCIQYRCSTAPKHWRMAIREVIPISNFRQSHQHYRKWRDLQFAFLFGFDSRDHPDEGRIATNQATRCGRHQLHCEPRQKYPRGIPKKLLWRSSRRSKLQHLDLRELRCRNPAYLFVCAEEQCGNCRVDYEDLRAVPSKDCPRWLPPRQIDTHNLRMKLHGIITSSHPDCTELLFSMCLQARPCRRF